ncbi:hypothetical protein EVA_06819 [gut metagenome]|uniref:Uncharacterized protein n=1 Tax=gut metagenome TaxID=749906 RepID=J9GRD5_9ZZZZ
MATTNYGNDAMSFQLGEELVICPTWDYHKKNLPWIKSKVQDG